MKAIVFADRLGVELSPLNDKTSVALLPFAAKPVLDYALEQLLLVHADKVFLVVAAQATPIQQYITSSHYWDLDIEYVLSRGEENPATLLPRLGSLLNDDQYIIMRGDLIHNVDIKTFHAQFTDTSTPTTTYVTYHNQLVGVAMWQRDPNSSTPWADTQWLSWAHLNQENPILPAESTLPTYPVDTSCCYMRDLKGYHAATIVAAAGQFQNVTLPGYSQHDHLQVGQRSQVNARHQGLIGAYCYVHPRAMLHPQVVLCDRVVVSSGTDIDNSVVLPDSYIGPNLEIKNAIVWGKSVIRIDGEQPVVLTLPQVGWLADLRQTRLQVALSGLIHRSLALITAACALPLLPFAAGLAWLQNPQQALLARQVCSNRYEFNADGVTVPQTITVWEWQTSVPLFRHLPKLLAVITGHWHLVGISPETPEALPETRDNLALPRHYGLICPSHLSQPQSHTERKLLDHQYAATQHLGHDLYWLGYGLLRCFTPLAWVGSR